MRKALFCSKVSFMNVFNRFRRNRDQGVLPAEVHEYYQAGQRQKRGTALAVVAIALIATILIGTALFFAGKAIYNNVRNDDKKAQPATDQNKPKNNGSDTNNADTEDQPDAITGPAPNTAPNPAPEPSATPVLGDTPGLPRTGDDGL